MILVDTSVWIDHFRGEDNGLYECLDRGIVLRHPFVIGELACGNLKNRRYILTMLSNLPAAVEASDGEVIKFIEKRSLYGRGIGYIDMHLLASAALTPDAILWTMDTRLREIAELMKLGVKL